MKCRNCFERIVKSSDNKWYHTSFNERGEFPIRDSDVGCKAEPESLDEQTIEKGLPKTKSRDSSKDEFRKKLNDEEAEIYFIGLKRGFEQARKQLLEVVKKERKRLTLEPVKTDLDISFQAGGFKSLTDLQNKLESEVD